MSLITDRTAADLLEGNARSRYNAADLNRVETEAGRLSGELAALEQTLRTVAARQGMAWDAAFSPPHAAPSLTVKTNWSRTDLPTEPQMARYLSNVRLLAAALDLEAELPASMAGLTIQGANRIEQALVDCGEALALLEADRTGRIQGAAAIRPRSGTICSGMGPQS